jgi:hypothetical protein
MNECIVHDIVTELVDSVYDGIVKNEQVRFFAPSHANDVHNEEVITPNKHVITAMIQDNILQHSMLKILSHEQRTCNGIVVHMYQLKSLRQRVFGACGYFAIFNALTTMRALVVSDMEDRIYHLNNLNDRTRFWFTYHRIVNELNRKAKHMKQKSYPWSSKYINTGILERDYMNHILNNEQLQVPKIGRDNLSAIPDLSPRSLRNGILTASDIRKIHNIFRKFSFELSNDRQPVVHAFICGAGNHWWSYVIHRAADRNEIEAIYFDSRNNPILGRDEDNLKKQVEKRFTTASVRRPDLVRETYLSDYYASLHDTSYSVNLILKCICGEATFIGECLDLAIGEMLNKFYKICHEKTVHELMIWMNEHYHPAYIRDSILGYVKEFGVQYMSTEMKIRLENWLKETTRLIDGHEGDEMIMKLHVVLCEIQSLM